MLKRKKYIWHRMHWKLLKNAWLNARVSIRDIWKRRNDQKVKLLMMMLVLLKIGSILAIYLFISSFAEQKIIRPNELINQVNYSFVPLNITLSDPLQTHFKDDSVIFLGMVNNAQKTLPHILQQLDEAACLFKNANFLFFESNSKDDTPQILEKWKNTKMNETFCANIMNQNELKMSQPNVYKQVLFGDEYAANSLNHQNQMNNYYFHWSPISKLTRVQRYVAYRNVLLNQTQYLQNDIETDYVFIIDLDVFEIDFHSFFRELADCPMDIMCVNGRTNDGYYDTFALTEMDNSYPMFETAKGHLKWRKQYDEATERYLNVRSCFGGLVSYKMKICEIVKDNECKYFSNNDLKMMNGDGNVDWINDVSELIKVQNGDIESNICEHIPFYYCLAAKYNMTVSIARYATLNHNWSNGLTSAACKWNALDLSSLSSNTIQCIYGRYGLEYTPCSNNLQCEAGDEFMIAQFDTGSNQCILHTATWDNGNTKPLHIQNETISLYTFEYTNGAIGSGCVNGRHTRIQYICDEDAKPYDNVQCGESGQTDGVCNYWMVIYTHLACGNALTSDAKISIGSILLIAFFSLVVFYCVVGYMINGFKTDNFKDFKHNTPHLSFWVQLPSLVVAGCQVTYECVRGQRKKDNDDDKDTPLVELDQ